ncbi:MutS protein msh5, variant 2 [Clonorchis sinensis]|nr:MutS protein msh5, variant 2 [Clonorchis sinensis]
MDDIKRRITVHVLSNRYFANDQLASTLYSVNLSVISGGINEEAKEQILLSYFPPTCSQTLKSFSALFSFLSKKEPVCQLGLLHTSFTVLDIQMFKIEQIIYMDERCLRNLQIFGQFHQFHESWKMKNMRSTAEDETSVFKLFSVCITRAGKYTLEQWMRTPSRDLKCLNERLTAVECLLKTPGLTKSIRTTLRNIGHLPRIFYRMQQSSALPTDWKCLMQTLTSLEKLIQLCMPYGNKLFPMQNLLDNNFDQNLSNTIQTWMMNMIDFDALTTQHRFSVKQGLDPKLDEWIQTYRCLPDLLSQLAEEELRKLRESISTCGLIYFPLVGFLLKIPKTEVETPDIEMCDLSYAFTDNDMAYYRNDTTRELDQRFGDVMYAIIDSETAIMHRLQDRILEHAGELLRAHQFAAEIDCLCAFALAASSMNGVRPKLVDSSVIYIKNGWHPIQALVSNNTIRNSFYSGNETGRTTMVTGPNASGKSVYIKQIGITVYLSQIGSFVPAEEATIGPMDAIYAITCTETLAVLDRSSDSLSLNLALVALRFSTERSLILLDEFAHSIGKTEASALTAAIIEHLLKSNNPHLVATTHAYDMLDLLRHQTDIKFTTMKTRWNKGKLIYLYEAIEGVAESSRAIEVACSAGIPSQVTRRARELFCGGKRRRNDSNTTAQTRLLNVMDKIDKLGTEQVTCRLLAVLHSKENILE